MRSEKTRILAYLRGESHIDFRTQCVIVTRAGGGGGGGELLMTFGNSEKLSNLKVHVL